MYGTIFRMRPVAGKERDVINVFKEWESDRKPNVKGVVGGYLMKPDADNGELIGVAVFESKEAYLANGNDPAQGDWFMKPPGTLAVRPSVGRRGIFNRVTDF